MAPNTINRDLLVETRAKDIEQQSDAPAKSIRAEADASDDRLEADRCPHTTTQVLGEQATSHEYSEEALRALAQVYELLLKVARQNDTPDDQPLDAAAVPDDDPDTSQGGGGCAIAYVESGVKEAVNV